MKEANFFIQFSLNIQTFCNKSYKFPAPAYNNDFY